MGILIGDRSLARFASNWELSGARAITIVRALIRAGIPPQRLVATGFAEYDPIDNGESATAFARNRRIEIKFTSR
jgi:chemotaxis protein MotB